MVGAGRNGAGRRRLLSVTASVLPPLLILICWATVVGCLGALDATALMLLPSALSATPYRHNLLDELNHIHRANDQRFAEGRKPCITLPVFQLR